MTEREVQDLVRRIVERWPAHDRGGWVEALAGRDVGLAEAACRRLADQYGRGECLNPSHFVRAYGEVRAEQARACESCGGTGDQSTERDTQVVPCDCVAGVALAVAIRRSSTPTPARPSLSWESTCDLGRRHLAELRARYGFLRDVA